MSVGAMRRISAFAAVLHASGGDVLHPFQAGGAEFLARRQAAILADDPGLGNAIQCLAALHEEPGDLVVVGPSILVEQLSSDPWSAARRLRPLRMGSYAHVSYDDEDGPVSLLGAGSTLVVDAPRLCAQSWLPRAIATQLAVGGRVWVLGGSDDIEIAKRLLREGGLRRFDRPRGSDVLRRRVSEITPLGWTRRLEFRPESLAPGETIRLEVLETERVHVRRFELSVPGPLAKDALDAIVVDRIRVGVSSVLEDALPLAKLSSFVVPPSYAPLEPNTPLTIRLTNKSTRVVDVTIVAVAEVVVDLPPLAEAN